MQVGELEIIEINEAPPLLDLRPEAIAALADALVQYHAAFADLSYRTAQAHWGLQYLQGLLLPIARQSIEPMALALAGGDVQAMPQCIGQGQWQDAALLQPHWRLVDATLGEADGVDMVDGSAFGTQGEPAVGVARQWCGHMGTIDHGHAGVCAAYASRTGSTRRDRRLSLPDEWCAAAHRARWQQGGIPETTRFTTKPAVALAMLRAVVAAGTLRLRWVTCDEACSRETAFLDAVAAQQRWYDVEVPHDTQVWLTRPATVVPAEPAPQRVDPLATAVPTDGWHPFLITEGSTGPVVAACACQRGVAGRRGWPGPDVWSIVRRTLGESPERTVSLRNAPGHTSVRTLVRIAGMRWPIATAFEESQGGLGLDHDEVRSGLGWHQHMPLCLVAHHVLVRARQRVKKGRQP